MVTPAPDKGFEAHPSFSATTGVIEVQRCVFGKLVTEAGGPVAEGTEHTITSRTRDLPDEIASVCRPDRLLPVDVNPLRLVEPALKDIGGLLVMPLACPARSSPKPNWVLVSRLRAYPERGPDKGGRPATMMMTLAVETPVWPDIAARFVGGVCGSLVAVPDEIAVSQASRFGERSDHRPLPAAAPLTLGEVPGPSWIMLEGLYRGEPTHWSRKSFPMGEGDFLNALAAVYALLPPEHRHLPMVSSGIAFGTEMFDMTFVKDREPHSCELKPVPRPAFVDPAVRLDTLHAAKKKPRSIFYSAQDEGALQEAPPAISIGHWGASRRLLKAGAQRAIDVVKRRPATSDLAGAAGQGFQGRDRPRDSSPLAGQQNPAAQRLDTARGPADRAGANGPVSPEIKQLYDHSRVLLGRLPPCSDPAPATLALVTALAAVKNPMDDAQFDQDWPKVKALLQRGTPMDEIEVLEALRKLCQLGAQLPADRLPAADGKIKRLTRLLDLLLTVKAELATHGDRYVGELIGLAQQELIQVLRASACLTYQETEHAFDPARPTGASLRERIEAGDTDLLGVLQQSLWVAAKGLQPDGLYASERVRDAYKAQMTGFEGEQANEVLLNVIRRFHWGTPAFTAEQLKGLVRATTQQPRDLTAVFEAATAAVAQRRSDALPPSETFTQLTKEIQSR